MTHDDAMHDLDRLHDYLLHDSEATPAEKQHAIDRLAAYIERLARVVLAAGEILRNYSNPSDYVTAENLRAALANLEALGADDASI